MTTLVPEPATRSLLPEEEARRHLTAVLPLPLLSTESIEIRCLDTRVKPALPGPRIFLGTIEEAVETAMRYRERWDVFVGVASRACPAAVSMADCRHGEKGSDHVSRLQVVWGDFDVKLRTFEELLELMGSLSLAPPNVLVGSGKGLHAYWRLMEATAEARRVEAVNRSLRVRFGADNATDSARILRVAGTFNYKYGEPLPVRLLKASDV